ALSGFFIGHIRQLNLIDAACWLPWLVLLVERCLATGGSARAACLLVGAWTLSILAGHPQINYYTALVLVPYFLVRALQVERARGAAVRAALVHAITGRPTRRAVLAICIGTLVASAALVPAGELSSFGLRSGGIPW